MDAARSPTGDTRQLIYLDHAATTPLDPRIDEAMRRASADAFANPSSPHAAGRRARAILEDARERLVALLGGRSAGGSRDRLIFTSGATEANRLGMLGTAGPHPGTVGISPRDHGSVIAAAADLAARGWEVRRLPLAADGSASGAAAILAASTPGRVLLSTTLVCGQTGIRESPVPLAETGVGERLFVHADATQAAAWDALSFATLPLTTLALAPHKFGGPRGIGGLLVRGGVDVMPLTPGPQELGLRGGTEAVPLAVGFAVALHLAAAARDEMRLRTANLRDRFENQFVAAAGRHGLDAMVVGHGADRAPHIATMAVRGCDRQAFMMACDLAGIALATGTACASGSSDPSPAILALDLPGWVAQSAIRASVGPSTTETDITEAVHRLDRVFRGIAEAGLHAASGAG
ncbi:MAG: aminotransferase class V-fold PLP-dependent enzyme [Planctomycetes bacterium]|nr:aminotransferase class V-fold PLP-dependent enzyme [Planctomycetota bacterium]